MPKQHTFYPNAPTTTAHNYTHSTTHHSFHACNHLALHPSLSTLRPSTLHPTPAHSLSSLPSHTHLASLKFWNTRPAPRSMFSWSNLRSVSRSSFSM